MNKIDFHQLDGQILETFLTIHEVSSVSLAAERMGVTQSAVSHTLGKLRAILGDPLFVRSGQGIVPTETALSLKVPVQDILDRMRELPYQRVFDPKSEDMSFVIAANDMQRDLVLPELAMAPLPFATEPATIFMVWHERANNDPAHKWLRNRIKEIGNGLGFKT